MQADGRGLSPRPRGFSPVERFLPLAFSRQFPRPPLTPVVGTPSTKENRNQISVEAGKISGGQKE
ncbi:MAG: hypothetical protein ACK40V_06790 [Anaerolineales bacterium]